MADLADKAERMVAFAPEQPTDGKEQERELSVGDVVRHKGGGGRAVLTRYNEARGVWVAFDANHVGATPPMLEASLRDAWERVPPHLHTAQERLVRCQVGAVVDLGTKLMSLIPQNVAAEMLHGLLEAAVSARLMPESGTAHA